MGLGGDSETGGMGGDYTSWTGAIKAKTGNSAKAQPQVQACRGRFRECLSFAGFFEGG
jgi:hypothetical protein